MSRFRVTAPDGAVFEFPSQEAASSFQQTVQEIAPKTQHQPQQRGSTTNPIIGFFRGAAKGVGSTVAGASELGQRMLRGLTFGRTPKGSGLVTPNENIFRPEGTAERVGFGVEQAAEFFVPGTTAQKVGRAAKGLSFLRANPKAATLAGTATRAGTGAGTFGGVRATQTGEVGDEARNAAIAGAVGEGVVAPAFTKFIGAVSKKLPERFFSNFFKTTADDFAQKIRTTSMKKLQEQSPEIFDEYVKNGVIRVGKSGKVHVNPTLAREAIERGFGTKSAGRNLEGMAQHSIIKQFELENDLQKVIGRTLRITPNGSVVSSSKLPPSKFWIDLGAKKKSYITLLGELKDEMTKQGFGSQGFLSQTVKNVNTMLRSLNKTKGSSVPASDALVIRRFIDSMRKSSSFNANTKLAPKQAVYKEATDLLRRKLSDIPEVKNLMNEYRFYIQAEESLVKEAARRENNRIFSLFDAVVGGSSIGANSPVTGLGFLAAARTIQTPAVLTTLGQLIDKSKSLIPVAERTTTPAIQGITSLTTERE